MKQMKHFSTEEWIDFVNDATAGIKRQTMKNHLAGGCKACEETLNLWERVQKVASNEASYQPDAQTVRLAKAAFTTSGFVPARKGSRGLVEVLFDSFAQPALAGARSLGMGTRQMLYRADPYQIDVHIEAKPATNRIIVTGQLFDLSTPATLGSRVPVTLSNRRGNSILAATNEFGEFSGEIENSGDLELQIPGQGEKPIIISLRNALGKLPGSRA